MTPATTLLQDSAVDQTAEVTVSAPTKEQVIAAIRDEAIAKRIDCDTATAEQVYGMLKGAVGRKTADTTRPQVLHRLNSRELATLHDVFEVIMVSNDTKPDPGTAHALINEHFLPGGVQVLVHTTDEDGSISYCAVAIAAFPVVS
jgi:hypothetical protein